jgi:PAS domain S-box-containing protein
LGGALRRGGTISQKEAHLWKERYRVLFERNVAGIILTDIGGRIVDCNEPCARTFGFESPRAMLAHSAWDLYFDRAEREVFINRLRSRGNCPDEEVCLRGRNGVPVWVLTTRTVADTVKGRPELLLGTVIDITAQKKAQASLRDIKDAKNPARMTGHENVEITNLSQKLATLLQRATQALQPENLARMGRPEIKEFQLVLEEMKMLTTELEVLRLFPK